MPLTRATITPASRIDIPTYVIFFCWIGVNYLATPRPKLTDSPALAYADNLLPLPMWGVVFLVVDVLIVLAFVRGTRMLCEYALWVATLRYGLGERRR